MQILQGTLEFAVSFRWARICLYTGEQIATVFLDCAAKDLRWQILEEKVLKNDFCHEHRVVIFLKGISLFLLDTPRSFSKPLGDENCE